MARRRGFGEVERRVSRSGQVSYRARYAMSDETRYSRTLATKVDAEAWLASERALIDRDEWTPPKARQEAVERRLREAAFNTLPGFAERYLKERGLRPNTVQGYRALLKSRILPHFGGMPLRDVTLSEIKAWRASLDPATESTNAAAYRLLRSILQAAEEEELIDRVPPKVRGAATARVRRVAVPATLDELATITDHMPDRLKLLVVLAAYVGLRQGELLELRRCDVDGVTGRISVARKIDKASFPTLRAPARTAVARSAPRKRQAGCGRSTSRRRSCPCSARIYLSTPQPDRRVYCFPATGPTT